MRENIFNLISNKGIDIKQEYLRIHKLFEYGKSGYYGESLKEYIQWNKQLRHSHHQLYKRFWSLVNFENWTKHLKNLKYYLLSIAGIFFGYYMTNAELILKLVEMLIESEKKQNAQTANEQNGQGND